jgi:drug/metabolite transporter (DMT)-like permease
MNRSIAGRRFRAPAVSGLLVVAAYAAMVSIWGTTWLGIKIALHGLPAITGSGVRFLIAGAVLYALALIFRVDLRKHAPPLHLVIVLAFTMFGINYALTYIAETQLASGLVAVLFGTTPFFVFAFAHSMIGERASRRTIVGSVLAFAGVAIISLVGDVRGSILYVVAVLIASASSGYANVYLKRFADAEPLATLPPAMLVAGAGLTLFGMTMEHPNWHAAFAPTPLAALLYLAIFGSAIAFYLNHWLLQRIDSGTVGLSALMIPVLAVGVGALLGGESFSPRDIAGAVLVLGGVWISMSRKKRPAPVPEPRHESGAALAGT